NQNVDDCLYAWFVQKRSEGIPVSGTALKLQAEKFHVSLKAGDFKASDSWLWHWQKQHGIFQISIYGEAKSSDIEGAAEFSKQFTISIKKEGYTDAQVYNCDETALYYRMLPSKTLDLKSNPQKAGLKLSKERITALFCVNKADNHKLMPLISKNPKALLLLDNCPAHPLADNLVSNNGKIKVMYLPKNTTTLIQPLDQGIISAFKTNYRREMMKSLLASDIDVNIFF
ncbi:tigger transposable element-derived protein 7-like, partial [Centruroides vittatus]|uniref:tigger transposable element-derived protein 7-like n=1 Tax=Centruroides vittatus TaxID=120091 RepID=UPI00350ECD44